MGNWNGTRCQKISASPVVLKPVEIRYVGDREEVGITEMKNQTRNFPYELRQATKNLSQIGQLRDLNQRPPNASLMFNHEVSSLVKQAISASPSNYNLISNGSYIDCTMVV